MPPRCQVTWRDGRTYLEPLHTVNLCLAVTWVTWQVGALQRRRPHGCARSAHEDLCTASLGQLAACNQASICECIRHVLGRPRSARVRPRNLHRQHCRRHAVHAAASAAAAMLTVERANALFMAAVVVNTLSVLLVSASPKAFAYSDTCSMTM